MRLLHRERLSYACDPMLGTPLHLLVLTATAWLLTAIPLAAEPAPPPDSRPSPPATEAGPAARPRQILLITVDTLRPDALSWIDDSRSTPSIDRLAREGFRFPGAVAPVPLTLPSHATLLTGLEPLRHGVRENGQILASSFETLPERLEAAGYRTAAFVSGYPLSRPFGTAQGFARYDDDVGDGDGAWLERRAPATTDRAIEWIRAETGPWFAWVHYYDPHLPYEPPEDLAGDGPRGRYDGEVALVDRSIGRLLAEVERAAKPTARITLFAADHGESLGEHGEASHGYFIYDSTLRVPLIFHAPGRVPSGENAAAARLADVAPTLLDLLGLPPGPEIDGVSLTPLFAGEEMAIPPAAIESLQPWSSYGWAPLRGVRRGSWKYIAAPRPELYDLAADPAETKNLVALRPEVAAELRSLIPDAEEIAAAHGATPIDPEVAARLRSLGYVSSGGRPAAALEGLADPKDQLPLRDRLTRADAAIEAGDYRTAVKLCDEVLAEDPKNRFALSRSAYALLEAGFPERAVRRLERVVELDPAQSESRTLLAETLTRAGAFDRALVHWQELVAQRPTDPKLWSQLGSTFGMAGEPSRAVVALEQSVALEPESLDRRLRLAFAQFAAAQPGDAAETLLEIRAETGEAFSHHGTLGVFLLRAARLEEALAAFEQSVPEHGDFAEGRFEWASWAAGRGDDVTARRTLAEALRVRPELRARAEADSRLRRLLP